ncbi:MAG: putative ABC transporter permease [Lachnospiraceae bacterium]|jgi:uncharacterized membrane protein|nr:putative ABC transporter permease [Lachnospiraceae bacterium]MEE3460527.1 putative ABC transporter permease [Lachnospiraceae bacterium]
MKDIIILDTNFYFIAFNFFIYGFFGWIYETIYESIRAGSLINRGFLTGPLIPLYGLGADAIYLILRPFTRHPSVLFLAGMIFCTTIEYLTSVMLEKLFHTQWWTYDYFQFNYQNRIALVPSLFWGYMTLLDFDFLQPGAIKIIDQFPYEFGQRFLCVLLIILAADIIFSYASSFNLLRKLQKYFKLHEGVLELKPDFLNVNRRILGAFPGMKIISRQYGKVRDAGRTRYLLVKKHIRILRQNEKNNDNEDSNKFDDK